MLRFLGLPFAGVLFAHVILPVLHPHGPSAMHGFCGRIASVLQLSKTPSFFLLLKLNAAMRCRRAHNEASPTYLDHTIGAARFHRQIAGRLAHILATSPAFFRPF